MFEFTATLPKRLCTHSPSAPLFCEANRPASVGQSTAEMIAGNRHKHRLIASRQQRLGTGSVCVCVCVCYRPRQSAETVCVTVLPCLLGCLLPPHSGQHSRSICGQGVRPAASPRRIGMRALLRLLVHILPELNSF